MRGRLAQSYKLPELMKYVYIPCACIKEVKLKDKYKKIVRNFHFEMKFNTFYNPFWRPFKVVTLRIWPVNHHSTAISDFTLLSA